MALKSYDNLKHGIRFWLLRRLPTCQETVQMISQSMERPLTLRARFSVKLHLWICAWCQWYLEQLQLIRVAARTRSGEIPELSANAVLSDEARERIRSSLANQK